MADNNIAVPLAVTNRSVPTPTLRTGINVPALLRSWSTKVPTIPNASIDVPTFTMARLLHPVTVSHFSLTTVKVTVVVPARQRTFTVTR
jgi:hypothetical protein